MLKLTITVLYTCLHFIVEKRQLLRILLIICIVDNAFGRLNHQLIKINKLIKRQSALVDLENDNKILGIVDVISSVN